MATTTKGTADVTTALAPTLTVADRCDRCGAQAYVRARLISGGELLFCGHHGREHLPKLQDLATEIEDETDRLHETSSASAGVDER
jgi:hypothetical protein